MVLAGAIVLLVAIDPRHSYHSALVYLIIAEVLVWLALAAAFRLVVAIVQVSIRLLRRPRGPDAAAR